jgi:ribosomal protein S27AE
MTDAESSQPVAQGDEAVADVAFEVRFADRSCPRCRSRFVASYYQDDRYVKSRCLDCMLFWPTPMMA